MEFFHQVFQSLNIAVDFLDHHDHCYIHIHNSINSSSGMNSGSHVLRKVNNRKIPKVRTTISKKCTQPSTSLVFVGFSEFVQVKNAEN